MKFRGGERYGECSTGIDHPKYARGIPIRINPLLGLIERREYRSLPDSVVNCAQTSAFTASTITVEKVRA
jgi:hypothetical protein